MWVPANFKRFFSFCVIIPFWTIVVLNSCLIVKNTIISASIFFNLKSLIRSILLVKTFIHVSMLINRNHSKYPWWLVFVNVKIDLDSSGNSSSLMTFIVYSDHLHYILPANHHFKPPSSPNIPQTSQSHVMNTIRLWKRMKKKIKFSFNLYVFITFQKTLFMMTSHTHVYVYVDIWYEMK